MPDGCQIVCKANPFDRDSLVRAEVQAGQTLLQMLGDNATHACAVTVGGYPVPRELWAKVKPKAGTYINVAVFPQGGNGGKWLRTILLVVVAVVAIWVTGGGAAGLLGSAFAAGTTGAALLGATIGIIGSLAINALIPPPMPKGLNGGAQDPFQQLQSITGTSNQAAPYGVIPCVVGQMRFFPPHAALPYTEISGDDQYLRMLLDLGYGDLDISDIQIGGAAISTYQDVEYEISTAPKLFTQDVYEAAVGVDMSDQSDTATRTTQTATDEISLDLIFSQGLFGVNDKGKTVAGTTSFVIEYAVAGSGVWVNATTASGLTSTNGLAVSGSSFSVTSQVRKTLRCGIRWKVTAGQYDVRVTRGASSFPGAIDNGKVGGCAWSVLRSLAYQNPSTTGTLKLAVRIRATDQLNGVVQNLSVLAAQKIPTWSPTTQTWGTAVASQNPAWVYAWLMTRCPAVKRRLADTRLDLDGISDWADECTAKGLVVSYMMDSSRAFVDVLKDTLAAGRATFGMINGKYGAIRDLAQSVPVQMFTPANSSGFQYVRAFSDLPHALRVKFTNPEANYQQDERLAYADGYTEATATRFEELDLRMVTDPGAAWKLGRYHLAVAYNRPSIYTLQVDIEHMVCERGDLVRVAHDITEWGDAWGRISNVSGSTVQLDGPVDLAAGETYKLQVRREDGSQASFTVSTPAGNGYTVLTLATTPLATDDGCLFVLGTVAHGTADLIVKNVEPGDDLSAKLTLVDAAPAVLTADSGVPPTFVSSITGQSWCAAPDPPTVTIRSGDSAPDDAGVIHARGGVSSPPGGGIHRLPLFNGPGAGGRGFGNRFGRVMAL